MDDDISLTYKNKKKQRRCRCIVIILVVIIVFIVGFLIGYFVKKAPKPKAKVDKPDKKAEYQKQREETMEHHKHFLAEVSSEELESNVKYFSKEPHIAGSDRQKNLSDTLAGRWRDYGFDQVELPMYKVLLSFPDKTKDTTVTIKYKNGTIIHQIKGKEQEGGVSEKGKDVIQPFLGYSPSGRAQGELVYVNYGRVEDFEMLKNFSVNVTGKIAIMRYGSIFRGNKIANAAAYGAKAALLYSDPADYALMGGDVKNTYPNTAWLPPSGVQRGSLYTMPGNGDPQTPGLPSVEGIYRRPYNESQLPPIPAQPMGYGDAIHFLNRMSGPEAPKEWQGKLNITYRLGPGFNDNEITVDVDINNVLKELPIYNVIGTIYGREEPDRYVLIGNHRDSWVYGAVDAVSGTALTTEVARVLGELLKAGWRPRRTIKICSWAAEEYSLIGSVEWVEQHEKILRERAVIYLNTDIPVAGNFVLMIRSSPLVKDNLLEFSKRVKDPNAHDNKETIFDIMLERLPSKTSPGEPYVGNLGSGSDFASFYQFVGVPSVDFHYTFGYKNKPVFYPVYHSQHDTFDWVKKFVDPKFEFHRAVTRLCGALLMHYSDVPLLDMSVSRYATALKGSLKGLKEKESKKLQSKGISLTYLEEAVEKFQNVTRKFNENREKIAKRLRDFDEPSFSELRRVNDQIIQVERAFIYSYGLPGRPLVRHVIFAPSLYNLYSSSSFPGVSDVLFKIDETDAWDEVERQISIATQAILSAVDILTPY